MVEVVEVVVQETIIDNINSYKQTIIIILERKRGGKLYNAAHVVVPDLYN